MEAASFFVVENAPLLRSVWQQKRYSGQQEIASNKKSNPKAAF